MRINVVKSSMQYLDDCAEILKESDLGEKYFRNTDNHYTGKEFLYKGFESKEVYIGLDETGNCVGFVLIRQKGAFSSFPFLHVIAVKKELRGNGIGSRLLSFFEDISFNQEKARVAFLIVGDYNPLARKFYEKNGYAQVGSIPDLYVKGITEFLMMKSRSL